MQKYFKYIFIAVILFFGVNNSVKAENVAKCVYDLDNGSELECNIDNINVGNFDDINGVNCILNNKVRREDMLPNAVNLSIDDFREDNAWKCPSSIYYNYESMTIIPIAPGIGFKVRLFTNFTYDYVGSINGKADLISSESYDDRTKGDRPDPNEKYPSTGSSSDPTTEPDDYVNGCDDIPETIALVKKIYNVIKLLIPIAIIGLSIVDFLKVLLNNEEKVYKAAWSKFIKRLIIGIIIVILPVLLSFIINLSGVTDTYGIDKDNIFCIFI